MIYVAPTAVITGDVAIREASSIWHGALLRGDLDAITVGRYVSVQDNAVVHVDVGNPVSIGDKVTVGHGAIVHGCEIGESCIVGMASVVQSRARVGSGCILAAGAVVPEGVEIPPDSIAAGVPARVLKKAEDHHRLRIDLSWRVYYELAQKSLAARPDLVGDAARRVRIAGVPDLDGKF